MRTYILSLAPQSYHKKKSDRQNMGTEIGKDFFKVFFTDYAITVFPLYSPSTLPPNAPTFPPLSSCPWVVHTSSLSPLFPIPFLSLPIYLMPTNHASSSLYIFPPVPPFPIPTEIPLCDVHFSDSVPVLVVCLVFIVFLFF